MEPAILRPGETCWRLAKAARASVLVDAASYFRAFADVVGRARRSVFVLGWDIDSRVKLWRENLRTDLPPALGEFLNAVAARRESLRIRLLDWDFAMIYALEREPLPVFQLGWRTHSRVHFHLDDRHPVGASHHQKIVVVDDDVAFAGGIDLAKSRWDTPDHTPGDSRRRDPEGDPYRPFHDAQWILQGDAAAALGNLARQRWERATGERLEAPARSGPDLWPESVPADFEDVLVGIARTDPAYGRRPEVREVEALHRAAIAAAKRCLYIESQYLTSWTIAQALLARLAERNGPEVVLVVPFRCAGWLEETTMGTLRRGLLRQLREADAFGRLHVYHPHVSGLGEDFVNVHAKILVVDDVLLRVGSANLSNRSMGFDTECDVALEGRTEEVRRGIEEVRNRLLAEHLGTTAAAVDGAIREQGSLSGAIAVLSSSARSLRVLPETQPWLPGDVAEPSLLDPERPAELERFIEEFEPEHRAESGHRLLATALLALALVGLAAAWRWTPLGEWVDRETVIGWVGSLAESPYAPFLVLGLFAAGGLVAFPVVLLILATAMVFGPIVGFTYALLGSFASALLTYGLGSRLGRDLVRRLAGPRLNQLSRRLSRHGFLAVLAVRMVPVAPFSVVNLVAGASHIRFRDFALGTLAGMTPGTLALAVFGDRLENALRNPGVWSFVGLGAVAAALVAGLWWLRRKVDR